MEQQWFIISNQILVERKFIPSAKINRSINSTNTVGNFVNICARFLVGNGHYLSKNWFKPLCKKVYIDEH